MFHASNKEQRCQFRVENSGKMRRGIIDCLCRVSIHFVNEKLVFFGSKREQSSQMVLSMVVAQDLTYDS